MHRNRPTTVLTWLLLVTLFVNSTTAPAIAHSHADWDISGDHHFGGHAQGKFPQGKFHRASDGHAESGRTKRGHACDHGLCGGHGHLHHRGGFHAHSTRAERSAEARSDRDGDQVSAASVVRHWHVSWLALEFTIPAPPERSESSDRDRDSAPSVVRLYDHTSPVIRAEVGGKFDPASCSWSLVAGHFDDPTFRPIDSHSASPPLLCGIAPPRRLSVLRI